MVEAMATGMPIAAEVATEYARRAQGLGMSLSAARELLGTQWPTATEGGMA